MNLPALAALAATGTAAGVLFHRMRQAEARARAADAELLTIQTNSPVALLLVDENLEVRQANGAASLLSARRAIDLPAVHPGALLGCFSAGEQAAACGLGKGCSPCVIRQAALDTLRNGVPHRGIETWVPAAEPGAERSRYLLVSTARATLDATKALVCVQDITERKRAEESLQEILRELEKALTEKTVLLKEIHHRVKNNLAVISSLLSMRADASDIPDVRRALEDSQQRVRSIALIHEHLYGSENLDRVDFAEYARQLVQDLHSVFAAEPARIAVSIEAEPIAVGVHRAVPCALILNELLMNAFKHAFPDGRAGEVRISFSECAPGMLELAVEDNGAGCPAPAGESRQALGLRIAGILAKQLEGTLERESSAGTRVVLRFAARPA